MVIAYSILEFLRQSCFTLHDCPCYEAKKSHNPVKVCSSRSTVADVAGFSILHAKEEARRKLLEQDVSPVKRQLAGKRAEGMVASEAGTE
jgi:hypothetical protein